jgi:hypothetical protein
MARHNSGRQHQKAWANLELKASSFLGKNIDALESGTCQITP